MSRPTLSTHVLDTSSGQPGRAVPLSLHRLGTAAAWEPAHEASTDADGRYAGFPRALPPATYRLRFDVAAYYAGLGLDTLYPYVEARRAGDMPQSGDRRRVVRRDRETGESVVHFVNRETGERSQRSTPPPQAPPQAPPPPRPAPAYTTAGPRLLLIPASVLFPSLVAVLLIVLEIYLHIQCHRQNRVKHESFYYRSPFHALSSRFCGACRESESAARVGLLQDRRRDRYRYLQGVVS